MNQIINWQMSYISLLLEKFKKKKFIYHLETIFWGFDSTDTQSLNKYNEGNKYLLCAIDLFNKYAWVIPIKDKKGTSIVNAFQKIISKRRKPNKIWIDQGIMLLKIF